MLTQSAIAAPALQEVEPTKVEKRDDYFYGLRIAKDGEYPPPGTPTKRDIEKRLSSDLGGLAACAIKAQPD